MIQCIGVGSPLFRILIPKLPESSRLKLPLSHNQYSSAQRDLKVQFEISGVPESPSLPDRGWREREKESNGGDGAEKAIPQAMQIYSLTLCLPACRGRRVVDTSRSCLENSIDIAREHSLRPLGLYLRLSMTALARTSVSVPSPFGSPPQPSVGPSANDR